jgi:hypothetical protein
MLIVPRTLGGKIQVVTHFFILFMMIIDVLKRQCQMQQSYICQLRFTLNLLCLAWICIWQPCIQELSYGRSTRRIYDRQTTSSQQNTTLCRPRLGTTWWNVTLSNQKWWPKKGLEYLNSQLRGNFETSPKWLHKFTKHEGLKARWNCKKTSTIVDRGS